MRNLIQDPTGFSVSEYPYMTIWDRLKIISKERHSYRRLCQRASVLVTVLGPLDLEPEGITILKASMHYTPEETASPLGRLESSATPLPVPQSQTTVQI
jgi:hypothetical protein